MKIVFAERVRRSRCKDVGAMILVLSVGRGKVNEPAVVDLMKLRSPDFAREWALVGSAPNNLFWTQ